MADLTLDKIHTIGIAGAGTMGTGIAQISLLAGFRVVIFDLKQEFLDKSQTNLEKNLDGAVKRSKITEEEKVKAFKNLTFTTDLEELIADVIIEAIIEKLEPKVQLFRKLEAINGPDTIFTTNTSSIPVTRIGAQLNDPSRLLGMHFFNPAHIMKLVEVISGASSSPELAKTIKSLAEKMGKKAVMAKDAPGFIVNRVARHFYVEGLKVLEERVASHEVIDDLMEASGFRMGPFRLMDLIGVDTNFAVTSSMFESFHYDSKFRPNRIQQQKVEAGHHGRKSGKGFYDYDL